MEIAVLCYRGGEIDPDLLRDDIGSLRERGWTDISLRQLGAKLWREDPASGRFFHVTVEEGTEAVTECVAVLQSLSCHVTLFVSLEAMSDAARVAHRDLASLYGVEIEDHSLRHMPAFHYRGVIGFHSDEAPLVGSPECLELRPGSPVCLHGPELARPQFTPGVEAVSACEEAAGRAPAPPGSEAWSAFLADALIASKHGFRRFGRLCVEGRYESGNDFRRRVSSYLAHGRQQLEEFAARRPIAFAHPGWVESSFAELCLRGMGYQMTFSGTGICRSLAPFRVPRLLVENGTPRPLDVVELDRPQTVSPLNARARDLARRVLYA